MIRPRVAASNTRTSFGMVSVAFAVAGLAVLLIPAALLLLGSSTDGAAFTPPRQLAAPAPTKVEPSLESDVSGAPVPTPETHSALLSADLPTVQTPPVRVQIPGLRIDASIQPVGVSPSGAVEVPDGAAPVGWYRHGAAPAEPGTTVLVGHVDYNGKLGSFFGLTTLGVGDQVSVQTGDGANFDYVVQSVSQVPKPELSPEFFSTNGGSRLVLISCTGSFDRTRRSYSDNVVVVATRK